MADISDHVLRKRLSGFGLEPGPITDTTRSVYLKKLEKLENESVVEAKKSRRRSNGTSLVSPVSSPTPQATFSGDESDVGTSKTTPSRRRVSRRSMLTSTPTMKQPEVSAPRISPAFVSPSESSRLTRRSLRPSRGYESPITSVAYNAPSRSYKSRDEHDYPMQQRTPTFYSKALLLAAIVFFVLVSGCYVYHTTPVALPKLPTLPSMPTWFTSKPTSRYDGYNVTLCDDTSDLNKHGEDCVKTVLHDRCFEAAFILKRTLGERFVAFNCDSNSGFIEGAMSLRDCFNTLKRQEPTSNEDVFRGALYLMRENPGMGLRFVQTLSADEGLISMKGLPLLCRLKRASLRALLQLAAAAAVCGTAVVLIWVARQQRLVNQKREQHVRHLAHEVVNMLSEQAQRDADQAFLPVVRLREQLVGLSKRSDAIWRDVIKCVFSTYETRVRQEKQYVDGEMFLVWRWLGGATPLNGGPTKVWQGKAVEQHKARSVARASACILVKNMIDPQVEREDDEVWRVQVSDAILERFQAADAGNNNNSASKMDAIVHMHLHQNGDVYVRCSTPRAAQRAYDALHGSWFDNKLVRVEFISELQYSRLFPDSQSLREPLKPSTPFKLSHPDINHKYNDNAPSGKLNEEMAIVDTLLELHQMIDRKEFSRKIIAQDRSRFGEISSQMKLKKRRYFLLPRNHDEEEHVTVRVHGPDMKSLEKLLQQNLPSRTDSNFYQ